MRKVYAYFFLLFVLLGSTQVTINQHLCNGELESTALFVEAQVCEHAKAEADLPPCHQKKDAKKCCSTNEIIIEGLEDFKINPFQQVEDLSFPIAITFNSEQNSTLDTFSSQESLHYKKGHPPPFLKEEIFIWDEVFLI